MQAFDSGVCISTVLCACQCVVVAPSIQQADLRLVMEVYCWHHDQMQQYM
jgi:hypothetical protein